MKVPEVLRTVEEIEDTSETAAYKQGWDADRAGGHWWWNPYAGNDWLWAALWWQGYSDSRQEIQAVGGRVDAERIDKIRRILTS